MAYSAKLSEHDSPLLKPPFQLEDRSLLQSPYLYMQAAGSDKSDGSSCGIHLRWDFRRSLGDSHLPKGNLIDKYPTDSGFNRTDDFVKVYKSPYNASFPLTIDFSKPPDEIVETGVERYWRYKNLSSISDVSGILTDVRIRFADKEAYDALRLTIDPAKPGDTGNFLNKYEGVLEIRPEGQTFFEINFYMTATSGSVQFKYEAISLYDKLDQNSRFISCRKSVDSLQNLNGIIQCEQMEYIRFQKKYITILQIDIITYENTIRGYANAGKWQPLGAFSLTDEDTEALRRLEDTTRFTVDRSWGKYNENDLATGAFTVKIPNYVNRWFGPEGLKAGVEKYLMLSQTDPEANSDELDPVTDTLTQVSYLQMLQVVSLDYHVARMLGLGHIDAMPDTLELEKFVYLAEYITESALEPDGTAGGSRVQHLFMTLPTSQKDYRLPVAPVLDRISYGLFVNNGTDTPANLADTNGYLPHSSVRVVNLFKKTPLPYFNGVPPFFDSSLPFCVCGESMPVLYGIEYKKHGEPDFRKPGISYDGEKDSSGAFLFTDHAGYPEVVPIPENDDSKIYVHLEEEEGFHSYWLYSINWFSRVSPLSNMLSTDLTVFPKRNTLLPPSNFAVQLIQEESPLIFTSISEQKMLMDLDGNILVRAVFDWNQVHNHAYQFADSVEFFFRSAAPLVLRGEIESVTPLGDHQSTLTTKKYLIESADTHYPVEPVLTDVADASRFVGSLLVANEKAYQVEAVSLDSKSYVILTVRNIPQTISFEGEGEEKGFYTVAKDSLPPRVGERFLLYENLSDESVWEYKLTKQVTLQNFLPTHKEQILQDDGQITDFIAGGIYQQAHITEMEDVDLSGNIIPGSHTGVFTIEFNDFNLPDHPDADVDFYKGTVRIKEDESVFPLPGSENYRAPEIKLLQVWKIDSVGPKLKLTVFDATFDPNAPSAPRNPFTDYIPIKTGLNVDVNFHPSYRVYLRAEGIFNSGFLLPGPGENARKTYMAARSTDTAKSCHSGMTPSVVLLALEMNDPKPPGTPEGPIFATRPDYYGKSTYTFDVEVNTIGRAPFALVFYRADARKILDTLYRQSTVGNILNALKSLYGEHDTRFQDRWQGLVKVKNDGSNFLDYDGYRFPLPDNDQFVLPNADLDIVQKPFATAFDFSGSFTRQLFRKKDGTYDTQTVQMTDIVREAIEGAFLPLTENPVLYKFIKTGTETSKRPPKIRDANGDLIYPENLADIDFEVFDPFPMVVKFQDGISGASKLRFTDYSLDGDSTSFFFYFVVELSNRMGVSPSSPIAGPVQLVNTAPADKPAVKKVTSRLSNPFLGTTPGVVFEVNPYIESEQIKQFQLFRTTDSSEATSVRTMVLAGTFDLGDEFADEFADLEYPPYGEPIYYRVVALRKIRNEQYQPEMIPSWPSDLVVANVVDNLNPGSPELSYTSDPVVLGPPLAIPNVKLNWSKTVHNGYYYLYKMNNTGNWVKIGQVETNDALVSFALADVLIKQNEEGDTVYHHFKAVAENASGLLSLEEKIFTI